MVLAVAANGFQSWGDSSTARMTGPGDGLGVVSWGVISVEPSTLLSGPTQTIDSGTAVSRMVNARSLASGNGNAMPSFGGIDGRFIRPATCWAGVRATATQISEGVSFTTSVRWRVWPDESVTWPPE